MINGDSSYQYSLTKDQNQIQIALPKDKVQKYIELEFSFPDAISPKEISLGSDDRKLSIGIEKITFIKREANFTGR